RRMQRQRADQPVRQVEQMHTLVNQLAASRTRRLGAPLAVVAEPSPVPVARAQVHQLAMSPGSNFLGGACDRGMKAMVETHLDQAPRALPALDQAVDLCHGDPGWLLDEDVGSCSHRKLAELGEQVMGGGNDYDIR